MNDKTVVIRKSGNLLDVSSDGVSALPEPVRHLLEPLLSYEKKKFLYGAERYNYATGNRDRRIETIPKRCYRFDAYGRLVTTFGFSYKIVDTLFKAGYEVEVRNRDDELERADAYDFDLDAVTRHFNFRAKQDDCLNSITSNPCGVINAITGFGKLVLITMVCLAYPNAKIAVTTRRATLVNKIADYLTRYIPNVGQIGGTTKKNKGRVTVYTAASLHHADFDEDIVLVDEAHELLADKSSKELARFDHAKMFAFSASPTGRLDGTDIRMEALFGRQIFYLSYQEAEGLGLVVPIRVEWSDVNLPVNPCAGLDDVHKKRRGIWRNHARNTIIANSAKDFTADDQVLITVDFIEHAVHLWQHLKEQGYTLVYNEMDERDMRSYKKQGLLPDDFPEMTPKRKEAYRNDFESGTMKKAISTIWDVGIDPVNLAALIRAEGNDSGIEDIQVPGRVCRINTATGKAVGIVRDFRDQFDASYSHKAINRRKRYARMGWTQTTVKP